ncbi:MAG: PhzF family phenazine biosynthesis protein [Prolixibacteraceae bacterium]|jgi:PhzF family phenazine biosynthesis protein|nr:PhzF family phenazine biosynthesis protein [Prolixibacteraceae bacterium]
MKNLTLHQVDAFAESPFTGNPAAVVIMDEWIPDITMQQIAMENNLSETAFIVFQNNRYNIRYFTPLNEVELCGHATLASAFVIFNIEKQSTSKITFRTQKRGDLFVSKEGDLLIMDFPADQYVKIKIPENIESKLGISPIEAYWGLNDLMLVFENEDQIKNMNPNFELLKEIDARGILITAKGDTMDFVSRFFAPLEGINEDPVTGSAHTTLIPYWSERLGKTVLLAKQLSKRGGTLYCDYLGERVKIAGKAIHYLTGTISI